MEKLFIRSAKTRLGADCGSDHELFIAKFRLKLKKVGKTTRPFTYDLNHITYHYTVKVKIRFGYPRNIFPFLLCFSLLFSSQLFVRPPQTDILLFCISFSWGWFDPCLLYNVTNLHP